MKDDMSRPWQVIVKSICHTCEYFHHHDILATSPLCMNTTECESHICGFDSRSSAELFIELMGDDALCQLTFKGEALIHCQSCMKDVVPRHTPTEQDPDMLTCSECGMTNIQIPF